MLLAWEAVRQGPGDIESLLQALVARKDDGYALGDILEWQLAKIETCLGRSAAEPSPGLARILQQGTAADAPAMIGQAERIQATIDALARNANARLVIRDLLMNVRG
jgi:transaldolase